MREVDYSVAPDKLPMWVVPLSVVMLVLPLVPLLFQQNIGVIFSEAWAWWLLPLMVLLILAHEAVHAIGWKLASGLAWSDFKFGFSWKGLMPYCHAKKPMDVQAYRIGAILPAILTGLLPLVIAYWLNSVPLILLSGIMISAAVGDVFVLWTVRDVPKEAEILDHPSQVGCMVYLPE